MLLTESLLRKLVQAELSRLSEGVDEKGTEEVLQKWSARLKKDKGIDVSRLKKIGAGTQGIAFAVPDGSILKVTGDASEAAASRKLMGKKSSALVDVYDVWRFGDTPFYAIHQEKLEPLSSDEEVRFNKAIVTTTFPIHLRPAGYDWDSAVKAMKDFAMKQFIKKRSGKERASEEELREFKDKFMASWNVLTKEFGIKRIHEALQGAGISFHDYQAANLMKRGNEYVLIDPGLSKGGETPEVLPEALRRLQESMLRSKLLRRRTL